MLAIKAEIDYVRYTWLPLQQKNSQAGNAEYGSRRLNTEISFEARGLQYSGSLDIISPTVQVSFDQGSFSDGDNLES